MDYSPAVPTALAFPALAGMGLWYGINTGTLILLLAMLLVALGAIVIRFGFRSGARATDVVLPDGTVILEPTA